MCTNKLLRDQMRARRRDYPSEKQAQDARRVFERIRGFEVYQNAKTVMAYMAARGEMSVQAVIDDVLASGRQLALPRCEAPGIMTARLVRSMDELGKGAYGLLEPKTECEIVAPDEVDLVLVPGAAFDRTGGRLGQGGGYYDRFLLQTGAFRLGVCHDFALLERLEMQAHDQRMDALAAPSELITTKNNG